MTDLRIAPNGSKRTEASIKVEKMRAALRMVQTEYASLGQRDRAKLIGVGIDTLDDESLAKLHDLILECDSKAEAMARLDAG